MTRKLTTILLIGLCLLAFDSAEAKRHKKTSRRRSGPPPTHPMVLWAKTLTQSTDPAQRRVAAYKLSQYSQSITHSAAIEAIIRGSEDPDVEIKVLCTKALAHAGLNAQTEMIRKVLIERYKKDPDLKDTVVRAFIVRKDSSPAVHDIFFDELKKNPSLDHRLILMTYFEQFGTGNNTMVDRLVDQYNKDENIRLRRAIAKVLASRAQGQDAVVGLFAGCAVSKDTPLSLICLDGLKSQARKDGRAISALEKTILSSDPDVLIASLDVMVSLPETSNAIISERLVEILKDNDDGDIQEKAALALGVVGDHSEAVGTALIRLIDDKETDESVRVAAVLVLGRQAVTVLERSTELLAKCVKENNSQSMKTACQLASKELEERRKVIPKEAKEVKEAKETKEAKEAKEDKKPAAVEDAKARASSQSEEKSVTN